jgi:hypothetical protein
LLTRNRTATTLFLGLPPLDYGNPHSLSAVLQRVLVKIKNVIELLVEIWLIGSDSPIELVTHARLDVVARIRRVPPEIAITFPRVAMLKMRRLTVPSAHASA